MQGKCAFRCGEFSRFQHRLPGSSAGGFERKPQALLTFAQRSLSPFPFGDILQQSAQLPRPFRATSACLEGLRAWRVRDPMR